MSGANVLDNDYEVLGRLGEGSFGKVYKAQHKRTGDEVAVKQIKLGTRSWDEAMRSMELQALKTLRHPFIVRLRELIRSQWDGSLYYIFEFIDSDLCRLVKANPNGLEEPRAAELARQLFAGISHMHLHNYFHRDLKPENILLESARETIRIADLGQARSLRARPPFTDYVGTRWYRAPECLLRDKGYSSPVDVWASGLICAELLRGSPIFCGTSGLDQLYKIFTVLGQPLTDWSDFARLATAIRFKPPDRGGCGIARLLPRISPQATLFLTEVLSLNPRRRPVAKKCLEHAFFAQLPPLDIERLDTHRSHRSTTHGPPDDPDQGGTSEDLTPSAFGGAGDGEAHSTLTDSAAPEIDVDLDAELDKILGREASQDFSGTAASASASLSTSLTAFPGLPASEPRLLQDHSPFMADSSGGASASTAPRSSRSQGHQEPSSREMSSARCAVASISAPVGPAIAGDDDGDEATAPSVAAAGARVSTSGEATASTALPLGDRCHSTEPAIESGQLASSPLDRLSLGLRFCRPWAPEEAGQLRRVVRRAIRRGATRGGNRGEALWVEVSAEVGGDRGPRECKLQYARDCHRSHQAKMVGASCRFDLADEPYKAPSSSFAGYFRSSKATGSYVDDSWGRCELRASSSGSVVSEPLCFATVSAGVVA